jgi:excisionase family DNA binding protein
METNLEKLPDVLTVEEVAKVLRLGRSAAYEAVRRGEIPSLRIGRRLIIPKLGVEKMLGRE